MTIRKWSLLNVLSIALLGLSVLQSNVRAQVVLNEVLADNRSAVANGGLFPDYIELHNLSAAPMNISGWSLTDDPLVPQKFIFPGGTTIPANGFLIVWADLNFAAPGLHTGFGLGAKGDLVRLYAADGFTVLDELSFGLQVGDYSMGRLPDGSGAWALNQPSAGQANTAAELGEASQLRLNEWMARPSSGDDWLEVFNADDKPVALGGFVITDTPARRKTTIRPWADSSSLTPRAPRRAIAPFPRTRSLPNAATFNSSPQTLHNRALTISISNWPPKARH